MRVNNGPSFGCLIYFGTAGIYVVEYMFTDQLFTDDDGIFLAQHR